jgi:hypothetical protein
MTLTAPSAPTQCSAETDVGATLVRRAVAAYEHGLAHTQAASLRVDKRSAAIAEERHRDAVSAAHSLAEKLGTTLEELPPDAFYRCYGDRPLAVFCCPDLPAGLLVTSAGNWGFGGRLLAHPLRLLDHHGRRGDWFDGLEGLGRELRRYEQGGERFGP